MKHVNALNEQLRLARLLWTLFWVGLVALFLAVATMVARGQAPDNAPAATNKPSAKPTPAGKKPEKWIGVRVMPLMPTTRSHLKKYLQGMPDDAGLTVTEVVPESPAVVAGIEQYDILLRGDGQPLLKLETLQDILTKRNFGTSVRIDLVHEGQPKTVYALVLERPEGEPGLQGGFRGRGGPGGPGGSGRGGPGGRPSFFGNTTSTLTYTDAEGKEQKVSGEQVGDFFRKMREDENFRNAVAKQGFNIRVKPKPPEQKPEGDAPPPQNP